ncbi:hypothetical protein [Agrococcus sp. Ld7]|uniref:hypothetical protein n=1 Tax=Agrococcus sp. Ld7 TaxID=649148 RepID=UPI00386D2953
MKTSRILALPAVAAASLLVLTGCIQLPPIAGSGGGTTTEPATDGGSTPAELAGTSWTGELEGVISPLGFTLNADGTVDITEWGSTGQTYDSPGDVWSGDASDLTVTIQGIEEGAFDLTASGTAEGGQMALSGQGTDGNDYTVTATQD